MRPKTPTTARPDARHAHSRSDTLLSRLNRFGVDNGGATAVVAAILFPIVVGGLGLGAETGYWYLTQRKLQHIADVSAYAAGARLRADDSDAKIAAAARYVARESGYKGTPELFVNTEYTHPDHSGKKLVEVVASETQPRLFSAVVAGFFSSHPEMTVTMSARAVGLVDDIAGTAACVLALARTAPGAVKVDGSSVVDLEGCDVASNSNASDALHVTSSLKTGCAYSVGGAVAPAITLTVCPSVKVNAPIVRDPYAGVAEPSAAGIPCESSDKVGKPNEPTLITPIHNHASGLKAMRFCTGLDAKGPVTFGPGLYFIEGGDFKMTSSNLASQLTGDGATFHFSATGRLQIAGAVTNFAAPTSGPYSGILFFASRSTPAGMTHQLGGNPVSTMNGAIYAPSSAIQVAGNAKATGGCTQVIGHTVRITGTSTLQSSCDGAGTTVIATAEVVKLIE
jgi:Flp pilus assembly protein TadG